jgi:hypothetical protein
LSISNLNIDSAQGEKMNLRTTGRILLGVIVCMALMSGKSLNAQRQIELVKGVSGNLVNLPGENKSPMLGGVGARARATGIFEGDEILVRMGAEGFWGAGTNKSWNYSAQGRFGAGVVNVGVPLYFMGVIDADFDGVNSGNERKSSRVVILGCETGKHVFSDWKAFELLVGATAGVAIIRADTGAKLPDGALATNADLDRKISRHVPGTGLSLTLTTGKSGRAGAVQVQCIGAALWGAGWRSSCSGDVGVSTHIQLGAGYRFTKLRSNEDEKVSMVAPFFRISFGRV